MTNKPATPICDVCSKPLFWDDKGDGYAQWKHVDRDPTHSPHCWGNPEPIEPFAVQASTEFDEKVERMKFERWYAVNRMQLYMHLDTRLRCAIEDAARECWMEGIRQNPVAESIAEVHPHVQDSIILNEAHAFDEVYRGCVMCKCGRPRHSDLHAYHLPAPQEVAEVHPPQKETK